MSTPVQGGSRPPIPSPRVAPAPIGLSAAAAWNKTLSVVLVSTQRRWYGGEEQARLLALGLRQRGHQCSILARRGGTFAQRMRDEGFDVTLFGGNGRSPPALWRIRRFLRHTRPNVLHFNDPHALSGAGVASLGLGIGARIAARRVHFDVQFAARYRRLCDRVVCVSHQVAQVCRESGIPTRFLRVVNDGVDPARVRSGDRGRGRRSLGLSDGQFLLLTVARLTKAKGHRFLLRALPTVLRSHPHVSLALVGDGELGGELKREAKQLGIDTPVRFLGYRDDVPDLIQAADLFVFPSQMEGLGSTLIDAMLAGRAIVTTTAGGIPDLTEADEGDTEPIAWTVAPRDPHALAEAILDAIDSPDKRALFEQRARQRAEQRFTADRMVESTLCVYRELLDLD